MDPNPERRARAIEVASKALAAMQIGEDTLAVDRLTDVVRESDKGHSDAIELMLLLFGECSSMVAALGAGGNAPVKMQVYDDDGQEVPIDQADPPVRTAVRTLLAEVHGDSQAALEQIEIALANAAPAEMAMVMLQALRWTIKLTGECASRGLTVADWIRDALA